MCRRTASLLLTLSLVLCGAVARAAPPLSELPQLEEPPDAEPSEVELPDVARDASLPATDVPPDAAPRTTPPPTDAPDHELAEPAPAEPREAAGDENSTEKPTHGPHMGDLVVTPSGYLEFFYSHNFNRPENNITALRGFDYINGSLMVGNFVMALDAAYKNFAARLALNIGASPAQFYHQEPATVPSHHLPSLDRQTWSFIQEALVGWKLERVPGLSFHVGVMATPIGIEGLPNYQSWRGSMASPHLAPKDYRENWNWSRSNSFIHVPDYHSGIRMLYSINERHHLGAFLLNGQNMVTDNNDGKTISFTYLWMPSARFQMSLVYMGGPERERGALEGQGWRHLLDHWIRWEATKHLHFMLQNVPGLEHTAFGNNFFLLTAAYASLKFKHDIRLAFRYEHLLEKVALGSSNVFLREVNARQTAALYGYTGTLSIPIVPDHLMVRLESRHDRSPFAWFYKGDLEESGDPHAPFISNAKNQTTFTIGMVGWF